MDIGTQPMLPTTLRSAELEAQEWNIVLAALQELPMRMARPVYDRLYQQISRPLRDDA
jgi:hypothetical protein